jgi:hypothetical protein
MTIKFRFFPEDRKLNFIYARLVTEWSFKFIGWLTILGALEYAYEKTSILIIRIVEFGLWWLIFGVIRKLAEYVISFDYVGESRARRYAVFVGEQAFALLVMLILVLLVSITVGAFIQFQAKK